jgi:hypothetical protein
MIEVEYNRITLTAIDARVRPEVLIDLAVYVLSRTAFAIPVSFGVPLLIKPIVLSRVFAHAGLTARSSLTTSAIAKRKLVNRLGHAATRATADARILGDERTHDR